MDRLPGFRFHPTEEELLDFYLRSRVQGKKLPLDIITTIQLYRFDPWELPGMARIGEKEWYFYVPRDHRKPGGGRPSRTTERGFWKATGCDRPVRSAADPKRLIGLKKTLVYYEGRAPRGSKTEWVMNEYRLPCPPSSAGSDAPLKEEDIVLCKIHRKAASMKELEQQAAAAEAAAAMEDEATTASMTTESAAISDDQESFDIKSIPVADDLIFIEDSVSADAIFGEDAKEEEAAAGFAAAATGSSRRPSLPELEVPRSTGWEWVQQDQLLNQMKSPWLVDFWSPSFASILNC